MVHNNEHENGLTPEALGCAEHLLTTLAGSPLSTATLRGMSQAAREELATKCPYASELMKYVVSCALDPGDSVSADGGCGPWQGEVGLCKSGEFGDWATSKPTTSCLQIVSACVLARVNAMDKQVAISLRGPAPALSMLPSVPVEVHYRSDGGSTTIKSFRPCESGESSNLPSRDCGWQPRYVGKCEAGDEVRLTVANGSDHRPILLRVCGGNYGCNHDQHMMPSYADWLPDQSVTASDGSLSFHCPSVYVSTANNKTYGYYSVMVAPPQPQGDVPCDVDVKADKGMYPASEDQVFTFREGAFYGNIFEGSPHGPAVSKALLSANEFACYTKQWNEDDAYLSRRLCASPEEDCFANPPQPCWTSCGDQTSPNGGYLMSCKGGSATTWRYPITTYLNHPDDLVGDLAARRKGIPKNDSDPPVPPITGAAPTSPSSGPPPGSDRPPRTTPR